MGGLGRGLEGTGDVRGGVEAVGGQVAAVQVGSIDNFFEGGARQVCLVRRQPLIQLPACVRHCSIMQALAC